MFVSFVLRFLRRTYVVSVFRPSSPFSLSWMRWIYVRASESIYGFSSLSLSFFDPCIETESVLLSLYLI
jgi:hypothetical protein